VDCQKAPIDEKGKHTCKHGDFVDVMKLAIALTFEAGPEVRDQDLGSLVEPDFASLKGCFVPEVGEVICEQVHQSCC
jgi:hypothetical protein